MKLVDSSLSYINRLLTNNSGTSIKSMLAFVSAIFAILMFFTLTVILWVDIITHKELKTSLEHYSQIILALGTFIFSGALPKIVGEIFEKRGGAKKNLPQDETHDKLDELDELDNLGDS